jgi:transglutaminase-like putative cysteine protease
MYLAATSTNMVFDVACELEYSVRVPSTLILGVHAQQSAAQTILTEQFSIEPPVDMTEFTDEGTGNRLVRLKTERHKQIAVRYAASVACDVQTYQAGAVQPTPVADLEVSTVPYLYPSRYCQSDQLGRLARGLFGAIENPHEKAVAIADWIHENVDYVRGSTTSSTSAYDTVTQRAGVCRDFSHLGIALCRALNIPARYFSGYAYEMQPPDFHACFECFIGGSWVVFDATRLAHLNGLVRVGTGRDAADASVASIFGSVTCAAMRVSCVLAQNQQFQPIDRSQLDQRGVSLEPAVETGPDAAAH